MLQFLGKSRFEKVKEAQIPKMWGFHKWGSQNGWFIMDNSTNG